jgi:hypothetical protein
VEARQPGNQQACFFAELSQGKNASTYRAASFFWLAIDSIVAGEGRNRIAYRPNTLCKLLTIRRNSSQAQK